MDPVFGYHILISLKSASSANTMLASVAPPCDLFYLNTSAPNFKLKQVRLSILFESLRSIECLRGFTLFR